MSKASVKISKNYDHRHHHQQHNTLKPRVYITHSSSFKTLVQQLTGNNGTAEPTPEAITHDLQIKHKDPNMNHNIEDRNIQDKTSFLDDPWLTTCGYTDCLSFVPGTNNQIDHLQDMNMVSRLLEVDPLACLFD